MDKKILVIILLVVKGVCALFCFIAFICGMFAAFASLATSKSYIDHFSNGGMKPVSQAAYIIGALLPFPMFLLAVLSIIAQLVLKKFYESKKKLFVILHVIIAAIAVLTMLLFPLGIILACETIGEETKTPEMTQSDYESMTKDVTSNHLAILNELKRVFGEEDAAYLYAKYVTGSSWGAGGGRYPFGRDGKANGRRTYGENYLDERKEYCRKGWRVTAVVFYFLSALVVIAMSIGAIILIPKATTPLLEPGSGSDAPPPEYDSQNAAGAPEDEPISASASAPEYDAQA